MGKQSILKIKEGQFVTIHKYKEGLKLCAVDRQNAPSVYIETRRRKRKNQMALCFRRYDGDYFPKVDGKQLMIDKVTSEDLSEGHWFEKINYQGGEHYHLQSVGDPSEYLSMSSNARGHTIFCLTESSGEFAELTDQPKP